MTTNDLVNFSDYLHIFIINNDASIQKEYNITFFDDNNNNMYINLLMINLSKVLTSFKKIYKNKNLLPINYIIYKLYELNNIKKRPTLIIKNHLIVVKCDQIWKKICYYLNWEFKTTIIQFN